MPPPSDNEQMNGRPSWVREPFADLPTYRSPGTADELIPADPAMPRARLLHLNESPYPPSPKAIAAAQAAATLHLNRYPDPCATTLARALSEKIGIPHRQIVFGSGSEELIRTFVDVAIGRGDHLVVPAPTFPAYAVACRLREGTPVRARLTDDGANDPRALISAITPQTRMLVCCTPNPPSGGMMTEAALEELVSFVPEHIFLLLDEAYYEFGRHAGGPDALRILCNRRGPWASLRTFSKAYGLAGLRIGYAICGSEEVAGIMTKSRLTYSITSLSQAAALGALGDEPYMAGCLDRISQERRRLSEGLRRLGLHVYPSVTNFVSARLPVDVKPVIEQLRREGILVRDWRDQEHTREIRITIGLPDDTDAVLVALKEILH